MRLRCLQVLKHHEKLNNKKNGTKDDFRGFKKLSKVMKFYSILKMYRGIQVYIGKMYIGIYIKYSV